MRVPWLFLEEREGSTRVALRGSTAGTTVVSWTGGGG